MNEKEWKEFQEKVKELNKQRDIIGAVLFSKTIIIEKKEEVKVDKKK